MNGNRSQARLFSAFFIPLLSGALLLAAPSAPDGAAPAKPSPPVQFDDKIHFLDGANLQGAFLGIDSEKGILWQHPYVEQPIEFLPRNLAHIRLNRETLESDDPAPTARFRFVNGDEILGRIVSLDEQELEIETWFGGKLVSPRNMLHSIAFFPKGLVTLYRGPKSLEGWKRNPGPASWSYNNGALAATGIGSIGRDVKLPDSSRIEFEVSWKNRLGLMVNIYTDVVDRLDYFQNSYILSISSTPGQNTGRISLQRIQRGSGTIHLGTAVIPAISQLGKLKFDIRTNKEEASIALLLNGAILQQWKDPAGFVAQGSGLSFYSQLTDASLRLSEIKVAQWDGQIMDESQPRPEEDLVNLVNKDKISGAIQGVEDGRIIVAVPQTKLQIPLERVTQLFLSSRGAPATPLDSDLVRAHFLAGGSISFQIEQWNQEQVVGASPTFGKLAFDPVWFHNLEFNLQKTRVDLNAEDTEDFFDFDE